MLLDTFLWDQYLTEIDLRVSLSCCQTISLSGFVQGCGNSSANVQLDITGPALPLRFSSWWVQYIPFPFYRPVSCLPDGVLSHNITFNYQHNNLHRALSKIRPGLQVQRYPNSKPESSWSLAYYMHQLTMPTLVQIMSRCLIIWTGSDNVSLPDYLNQCWNIVNWVLGNKFQRNLN